MERGRLVRQQWNVDGSSASQNKNPSSRKKFDCWDFFTSNLE